ncbi:MAG: phage tail protein [Bacteroidota bacterium]
MSSSVSYPQPTFYFQVDWDGQTDMQCSEVSGLDVELDEMTYRYGSSPEFTLTKMPGLRKSSDITIKKGVFKKDNTFFTWLNEVKLNVPTRKTVTIQLLDESGSTVMSWKLINAWPKKVSSPDMKADSSDVAIEEITIAHEGVTIEAS